MPDDIFNPEFWEREDAFLWDRMAPELVRIIGSGASGGIALLPTEAAVLVNWDVINMAVLDYARQYRYEWITKIDDTTRAFVQRAIPDWIESGASLDTLRTTLEQQFTPVRAAMIAETEVTRLYAAGNQIAYQSSGVVRQFRWMTANDELVCKICGPNNGKLFPLDQLSALIPAHVRCRCWDQPVVDMQLFEQQIGNILA